MEPVRPHPTPGVATPAGPVALTAAAVARSVARGDRSAQEVLASHLARIAHVDPTVRALTVVDAEAALTAAAEIDERCRRGQPVGPLAGVPFVVKDNIDVRRHTTASGSRAHAGVVTLRDAPVVSRLREAGAVLVGRANMDELAMGASTQTSAFGATRNPHDVRRSPGGSSGGCAAAVAAGMATVSVGTDTGGSIREPAAQCGVVGMAASPGLVPMTGVVPFAPELDRAGPLARTVGDLAQTLAVVAARRDLALRPAMVRAARALRVGVVTEFAGADNQPGVLARLAATRALLAELGVGVVPVSLPDGPRGLAAYLRITSAACVPLFEPYVRTGQAGEEVVRRFALGHALRTSGAAELADAYAVRRRLTAQVRAAFASSCDVLLCPTMPTTAPVLFDLDAATATSASTSALADPLHTPYTDCWAVLANLAGVPALSIPAGASPDDAMPVGMMLCGPRGAAASLLGLGALLESRGLASC